MMVTLEHFGNERNVVPNYMQDKTFNFALNSILVNRVDRTLDFSNIFLSEEQFFKLIDFLSRTKIQKLTLNSDDISFMRLKQLAIHLKKFGNIEAIDFGPGVFCEHAARLMLVAMETNFSLIFMRFESTICSKELQACVNRNRQARNIARESAYYKAIAIVGVAAKFPVEVLKNIIFEYLNSTCASGLKRYVEETQYAPALNWAYSHRIDQAKFIVKEILPDLTTKDPRSKRSSLNME